MNAQAAVKTTNHLWRHWPGVFPLLLGAIVVTVLSAAVDPHGQGLHAAQGSLGQAGYVYYHSERELQLMILHSATDLTLASGAVRVPGPARWFSGRGSRDGQPLFDWELEIAGGKDARFRIDGTVYDLSEGSVFVIQSTDGWTDVKQLQRDLSTTSADSQSVARFAALDPVLSDFTRGIAYREARH